jgi:hypothetical protein
MDGPDHLGKPVKRVTRATTIAALALTVAAVASAALSTRAGADDIVAPATRDVSPPGITPSPSGSGPLVRVPVPPRPPDPPRWRRFFLPATTDAATFKVGGLAIHIAGVAAPLPEAACPLADGTTWPCGQTALYSFRRFLHGRAVECYFAAPADATSDVAAPCRIGAIDLGTWLLAAGWAKPAARASDAYAAAADSAQCAGLGLWQGDPKPASCPPVTAAN